MANLSEIQFVLSHEDFAAPEDDEAVESSTLAVPDRYSDHAEDGAGEFLLLMTAFSGLAFLVSAVRNRRSR